MQAWRLLCLLGLCLVFSPACLAGRALLVTQAEATNMLMIPSSCKQDYVCPGVGPQIYTCNGTMWVNTNSNVTMSCGGELGQGVHNVQAGVPSYTFGCGKMQGNNTINAPNPSGSPTDLNWYRRYAINRSGCLADITYVTRTNVTGGVPASMSCTRANETTSPVYTADFTFWMCT